MNYLRLKEASSFGKHNSSHIANKTEKMNLSKRTALIYLMSGNITL